MARFYKAFIFYLTLPLVMYSQSQDLIFDHLSVDQGLSNNIVYSIVQDRRGFMWFGMENGLNKYDGYKYTISRHEPDESLSLSSNFYCNHWTNVYIVQHKILFIFCQTKKFI
jgi:ligand-binding sensor domain-containing protein